MAVQCLIISCSLNTPSAGGLHCILGQESGSRMPQLKSSHAVTKDLATEIKDSAGHK